MEIKVIGQMDNTKDHTLESANRVYDPVGICPTIPTASGGGHTPKLYEVVAIDEQNSTVRTETFGTLQTYGSSPKHNNRVCEIVAMRGRDKTNPSHRGKANENYEQRLEINNEHICNTLTSVQKDNLILTREPVETIFLAEQSRAEQSSCLIKQATKEGSIECKLPGIADLAYPTSKTRRGRVIEEGKICPTLTTESIPDVLEPWTWNIDGVTYLIRIRKLTPKECWRLMGFTDQDFEKAAAVNSNTQLYKQAGNSIVKDVLMGIFSNMIYQK